ncbi:MAG TPA: Wzz/FepE/Etk N-terminal domain-containing protein [Acidobacteriaceae bacterium]|nr:Wzz/FepE/Etk N-terminal domain-containing protein [Acidobacteriaceae bacterium]
MTSRARTATHNDVVSAEDPEYRVIDLRRFVVSIWKRRYFIVGCAIAGALLAYGAAWLMHPKYDATVRLMPPTPKGQTLSLVMPTRNPGDQYMGLISSRTVADDVIAHQHLQDYFHTTKPSELRRRLSGMAKISVDKDQFVTVTVRAPEPETALRIANEFPAALYRLNDQITRSEAEHQLRYFEDPLEDEKEKLAQAEEDLKVAQQKTGMLQPEAQVRLGVSAIAELRQQLAQRQEQLAGLETGRTSENPQVVTLRSQIGSLQDQIHRMEVQTGGTGTAPGAAKLPAVAMEVAEKEREVQYHETLFEILSKQYENAKIDEAYSPPVELVDSAVLPDEKSWPSRRLFALIGFVLGGLIGFALMAAKATDLRRRVHRALNEYESTSSGTSRA